jgi:hypothetical protein
MSNKLTQGEVKALTGRVSSATPYLLEIETATSNEYVKLAKSKTRINQQGQRFYDGDRTRITLHQGETLYALSPNSDAEIDVRPEGFDVDLFPRRSVYEIENVGQLDAVANVDSITTVTNTTDLKSVETVATGVDISGASEVSRTLDLVGREVTAVYAVADSSTDFNMDVSPNGSYWITATNPSPDAGSWSASTSVRWEGFTGFRYVRLRVTETGTAGDTADIVLQGAR